jgi:hypothetical protein
MTRKTLALLACTLIAPAVAAAQTGGLTKIQLYALQQQLKLECGLHYATGVYDPPTRAAIRTCNQKYGTTGNGAALLSAMNIGFSSGDAPPTSVSDVPRGMGTPAYNVQTGTAAVMGDSMSMGRDSVGAANRRGAMARRRAHGVMGDNMSMGRDSVGARNRARRGKGRGMGRDSVSHGDSVEEANESSTAERHETGGTMKPAKTKPTKTTKTGKKY